MDICYQDSSSFSIIKMLYIKFKKAGERKHTIYNKEPILLIYKELVKIKRKDNQTGKKENKQVDPRQTK